MTDDERNIMGQHAAYWQRFMESGQMVVFGPVLDSTGSWGLGVIETEDEDELRALAADDPAVASGTAQFEIGQMLDGSSAPADLHARFHPASRTRRTEERKGAA